jgi:hypothetical protein
MQLHSGLFPRADTSLRNCVLASTRSFFIQTDVFLSKELVFIPRKYFIFTIANAYYFEESPKLNQAWSVGEVESPRWRF